MIRVDLAVFAHNEAVGIASTLADLLRQSVWNDPDIDFRLVVLANGCTDSTVARASDAIEGRADNRAEVHDLPKGGKSRTWTRFVHGIARAEADFLVFADADIELPETGTVAGLIGFLLSHRQILASSSRPVKDLVARPRRLTPIERIIAASGGTSDDLRTAICGQLYVMRAAVARGIHLPAGLPVEDGFLRAMVLTGNMTEDEDLTRIDADSENWHIYGSERTLRGVIRHQTRIVLGGAVNAAVFAHLRSLTVESRPAALAEAASDDGWLGRVLAGRLPDRRYGWVPWMFLFKRTLRLWNGGANLRRPSGWARMVLGFGFDLVVYFLAQLRLAQGRGAGYW